MSNGLCAKKWGNPFDLLSSFESCILNDGSRNIWTCLKSTEKTAYIDVVMDNAGYELFTDLVLADFILHYNLIQKIRFHSKAIPWFISDVTDRDFYWTIKQLANSDNDSVRAFGQRLKQYVDAGRIELRPTEHFWTSPYEFQAMERIDPKLYADLSTSHLLIFKGDLNYRKILAEMNRPFNSRFVDVLGIFRPTNLCALRTVKTDCMCELPDAENEKLSKIDKNWMLTGKYGVIHFAPKP